MYRGLHFLGIFLGLVTDIVSSLIMGAILSFVGAIILAAQGTQAADIGKTLENSWLFSLISLQLGTLGTVFGGMVTGWFAKDHELVNSGIMLSLSIMTGLVYYYFFDHNDPVWILVSGTFMAIPAGFLGGGIWKGIRLLKPNW